MAEVLARGLPFDEAIEFLRKKVALTPEEFKALEAALRTRAFTVAGITSLGALQDLLDLLNRALEEGLTLQEFRSEANVLLEKRGYKGLTPYRADNIFRTNLQTAYSVGRYQQMTRPEVIRNRPYWQYDAVLDDRTRPTHRALHGKVFRADDPFWDKWYPPNGYRCRCQVISLTEEQVRRMGLEVEERSPDWVERPDGLHQPLVPDPGFDHNPGKIAFDPDLSKYPPDVRDAFARRSRAKGV
ncbi:MAG: phage minor head protein [Limnochordia bacterium]|jgi:SPP1 gp7 family putative phage head morphogenesis protein